MSLNVAIGEAAGQVWRILAKHGTVEVASVPALVKLPPDRVQQALGWLAREEKVEFREEGKRVWVSLVPTEVQVFKAQLSSKEA